MFEDVVEKTGGNMPAAGTYKRIGDDPSAFGCSIENIMKAQDQIYLMKWLYSEANSKVFKSSDSKRSRFPRFNESFLQDPSTSVTASGESTKRSGEQPGKGKTVQPM